MSSKRLSVAKLFQQADPLGKLMIAMTGRVLQGSDKTVFRIFAAHFLHKVHQYLQNLHSDWSMSENIPGAAERVIDDAEQETKLLGALLLTSIQGALPEFPTELCRSVAKVRKLMDGNLDRNRMELAVMLLLRPKFLERLGVAGIADWLGYNGDLAPLRRALKNANIQFAPGRRGRPKLNAAK